MKIRVGFVSNSSSSSYVIITANVKDEFEEFSVIAEMGDSDVAAENDYDSMTVPIDEIIISLMKAKDCGATEVTILGAGGYYG